MEAHSNVFLRKKENQDQLFFEEFDIEIDLNSENQTELRKLFYKIIEKLHSGLIVLDLKYDNYEVELFKDISKEFIKQLNNEIQAIYNNINESK